MRGRPSSRKENMEYKAKDDQVYRLVETEVTLRGGKQAKIYYFIGLDQTLKPFCKYAKTLPEGYEIVETKTKPLIKRKR